MKPESKFGIVFKWEKEEITAKTGGRRILIGWEEKKNMYLGYRVSQVARKTEKWKMSQH